jgi:cell division protein FtsQ
VTTRTVAHAPRAAFLALPPRARRWLLASAALAAVLAAGYVGWLRDSSLVAVEDVEVSGLTAPSAERIEQALTAAARDMTTLHVRPQELERAVAGFPVVQAIHVRADFPHGLHVRVVEHRPVAVLESGGERVPVAGDGTLLPDVEVRGALPSITAAGATSGGRLSGRTALALAAVAGAAPAQLLARVDTIAPSAGRGIVVELREGPELIFGDGSRPRAKWVAAGAVLAQESSQGASYLDLRIPERPAAGGLGADTVEPIDPAGAQTLPQTSQQTPELTPDPQPQVEGVPGG